MLPRPLADLDFVALAESFQKEGIATHHVEDPDPEKERWELSDSDKDFDVWIYPRKPETSSIQKLRPAGGSA